MTIPQPVINTFERVNFPYKDYADLNEKWEICNRFGGEKIEVHPLVSACIQWVYKTSDDYERGIQKVKISDFDRIRMFILKIDPKAYMECVD